MLHRSVARRTSPCNRKRVADGHPRRRLSMLRGFQRVLGIAILLALFAGESRAQVYGGYGWSGWGGGATPQGNIARGIGAYDIGAGVYNEDTAIANSINANTVERWNEYMFL